LTDDGLIVHLPPSTVEAIAQRAAEVLAERIEKVSEPAPYLSVAEAAEFLRCGRKRVYDLTGQRRLPYVKDGSRTLLRRVDLIAYLEGNE
jgi:excisionase family DNA binding protein